MQFLVLRADTEFSPEPCLSLVQISQMAERIRALYNFNFRAPGACFEMPSLALAIRTSLSACENLRHSFVCELWMLRVLSRFLRSQKKSCHFICGVGKSRGHGKAWEQPLHMRWPRAVQVCPAPAAGLDFEPGTALSKSRGD